MDTDPMLRELVTQQLNQNGVLPKLKAQLRANVFLALEENEDFKKQYLYNSRLVEFLSTETGPVIYSLVREFLQYFDLDFTTSVFDTESMADTHTTLSRSELCSRLLCNTAVNGPLLGQVVTAVLQGGGVAVSAPATPLNTTYTKPEKTPTHPTHNDSVKEYERDTGREADRVESPSSPAPADESINLLMFTPVAPSKKRQPENKENGTGSPKSSRTHDNEDPAPVKEVAVSKTAASGVSRLQGLPPLPGLGSTQANTFDITRMLDAGTAPDSEGSTADDTASKLSDADVTDTV